MKRVFLVATLSMASAAALAGPAPIQRPAAFQALVQCRSIADNAARLACFDAASATLDKAETNRDIVVVDRKQVRDTKRSLFGLNLPRLTIFGNDSAVDAEEVKSVEGVAASANRDGDGRWMVRLEDGAMWHQIDSLPLGGWPRKGSKIVVNRGAMGSYMMRVDGQPGIRVRREM